MRMIRIRLCALAVAGLCAPPAAALEPTGNIVADAFLRVVEAAGFPDARAQDVERVANSTILRGVSGGTAGGQTIRLDAAVIDAPTINADNELLAPSISYENVALSGPDGVASSRIELLTLEGVTLDATGSEEGVTTLLGQFGMLTLTGLSAQSARDEVITLQNLSLALPAESAPDMRVSVESVAFDLSLFEDDVAQELSKLGYDGLTIDVEAAGRWEAGSGAATITEAAVGVAGMGTLTVTGSASGLTRESLNALQADRANFSRLLSTLGTVTISGFAVSYRDAGLTEKLLTLAEEQTGLARAGVVDSLIGTLESAMERLEDAAFSEAVLDAARGFLNEPGEFRVRARPGEDVSALQLISAAVVSPGLIPQLLAIDIERQ